MHTFWKEYASFSERVCILFGKRVHTLDCRRCVYNDDESQSCEKQIVSVIITERKQERHVDRAQRVETPP
ncbi:MAG: hypothetical protein LBQ39_05840, partial [Tannerellaceae bacterium]|nr:hypothetical protein [Tannerellaceae bacterium]